MPRSRAPAAINASRLTNGDMLEWVEWPDDPRHELVFENEHTRIYKAQFDAGQPCETLFHAHREDTVYACISSEGPGGVVLNTEAVLSDDELQAPLSLLPPAPVSFTPGLCFCHLNKRRHKIHRIQTAPENKGSLLFVGAEVLAPPRVASEAPLAHPCYKLEAAQHPKARAYRVTVPPGGSTGPVDWGFCGVVVALSGRPAAAAAVLRGGPVLAPGDAFWFEGPVVAAEFTDGPGGGKGRQEGAGAAELLVFEWL